MRLPDDPVVLRRFNLLNWILLAAFILGGGAQALLAFWPSAPAPYRAAFIAVVSICGAAIVFAGLVIARWLIRYRVRS